MTKISDLSTGLKNFETQVKKKINAQKGGKTWVQVQKTAGLVTAAISNPLASIIQMQKSKDPADRPKAAGYFKTLRAQFNKVDLKHVRAYIKEHDEGGSKKRGMLSTAKSKSDEKDRVALAKALIKQFLLMQITINEVSDDDVVLPS